MKKLILKFFFEEKGASSAEYAIMVSLIAAVIIISVALLGKGVKSLFEQVKIPTGS